MKKSFLSSLIIFIILLIVSSVSEAYQYSGEIRVAIKYGPKAGNATSVASSGGLNVYNAVNGDLLYNAAPGESVYLEMTSSGFISKDKFNAENAAKISLQPQNGATVWCEGSEYQGYIFIGKARTGYIEVINVVGTDDYTSSVLGKEMSYSWPIEALKAQAVCARTFALCRGNAHKDYDFDVCSTTHCQVYGGLSSVHSNTVRASKETSGIVATYNGQIVPLYFFATDGGSTEYSENVWGSALGYLKSVSDPYEDPNKASHYSWEITLSADEIKTKLNNAGTDIGNITGINIDSVTSSGRVKSLTFKGTSGSKTYTLEKCRTILGLYSQKYTIKDDSCINIVSTDGYVNTPLFAISSDGTRAVSGYSAICSEGIINSLNTSSKTPERYTISGNGYGHGIGMSQWGARGMAEQGFTYDQILNFYFADIVLKQQFS